MKFVIGKISENKSITKFGNILFLSGLFLLPSSLFIGGILLLIAATIGSFIYKKPFFTDLWNYYLIIFGIFILISTLLQNFILNNPYKDIWDPSLSILGMCNWLPFIWLFWAFQPYLNSPLKRKRFSYILISGSFPILVSGFGQYFFNWHGPFETLYGLIVWYQRPIESPGGLSGLFSNQNYAGSWLNFVWPFCMALFIEKKDFILRRIITFIFLFSVGYAAFLTYSRNAWIGILASLSILSGKKGIKLIILVMIISGLLLFLLISTISLEDSQNILRSILPERIFLEFAKEGYEGLDATRWEILLSGINLIKINPIFGIGAGSFPAIFQLETGFWKGHSHNLLVELAVSYGLPAALILFTTISSILYLSGKDIFLRKGSEIYIIDRAIWTALFVFLLSQLFDIQYLDGKISILAWMLISSLKNIIDESNKTISK